MTIGTPWGEMLQAAARCGIAPEPFWRLSLREWRMLTAVAASAAPMGRGDLQQLVEMWPDE